MSSFFYAYSNDLNKVLNPFQAYEKFWNNQITDKRNFQCPGNNCSAQITCACIDIPETDWKQVPHFRVIEKHSSDCEYVKFILEESVKYLKKQGHYTEKGEVREVFILEREKKEKKRSSLEATNYKTKNTYAKCPEGYSKYTPNPKYYSIAPIVDNYFKYREDNSIDGKEINIGKKSISYENLFRSIYHKLNMENYRNKNRIFWGTAYLNRLRDDTGYRLKFIEKLKTDTDENINPSIIINDNDISKYKYKSRFSNYLNESSINSRVLVFAYGYLKENKGRNNNSYINIVFENLDRLDFKSTNYLSKLKKDTSDLF